LLPIRDDPSLVFSLKKKRRKRRTLLYHGALLRTLDNINNAPPLYRKNWNKDDFDYSCIYNINYLINIMNSQNVKKNNSSFSKSLTFRPQCFYLSQKNYNPKQHSPQEILTVSNFQHIRPVNSFFFLTTVFIRFHTFSPTDNHTQNITQYNVQ
jgi:hypothetical protein